MINVIKASAGSGKTYQLTYEYIKLLLGEKRKGHFQLAHEKNRERHRHILAVTFTNKATGEMKERIVKELSILAGKVPGKESPYMKDLCKDFAGVSPEDIKCAANRALVDLLFDYTNFNVSTIDSFFQMILRTFAKELKMSYNYDIELDDDYAIKVGVNDFLSSLAHKNGVSMEDAEIKRINRAKKWIKEFVREEVTNRKSWNIFLESESSKFSNNKFSYSFSFNDFAKSLTKEELRLKIDDIVDYLGHEDADDITINRIDRFKVELVKLIAAKKNEAVRMAKEIVTLCANEGFELSQINSRGGLQWISKINIDEKDYGLGVLETAKIHKTNSRSATWFKKGKGKNAPTLSEHIIAEVQRRVDIIAECNSNFLIYRELHRNVFMLGLLGEISHYLSKYRKENDLILLADTNELLHRIIKNEDMPFVYERVGIWLSHFLIDEFQDTSRAQWENMRPLLFNSCAEGCDNLIIGDEKQCIYRFRNADPTLLRTDVGKHFTVKQNDSGKCINWRSTPNVVKFNNDFFAAVAKMQGCGKEYANVQQDLPEGKTYLTDGYVEVNFVEAGDKTETGEKISFKEVVLNDIPLLIKDIVSRGYKYSDIAVLVSRNDEGADVIQRILDYNNSLEENDEKINVISNESLMLKNSSAVRLIISHLRYLDTKIFVSDDEHKSKIKDMDGYVHRLLRSYEMLMFKEGMSAGDALAKSFEIVPVETPITDELSLETLLPENTESFNIISITEHIIAQNITEEDLKHENAFIQAFQDSVVEFSNRQNPSIHEFLRWWDRGGCNTSVNSPDGQNAINVLTIHKSKGLEYKCVILPFCDWDLLGRNEVLWIPKEEMIKSGLFSGIDNELLPPLMPLMPKNDMELDINGLGDFYNEKMHSRIVDSLNKTYVGFTRAVDEMYIFTPLDKKESKEKENSDKTEVATELNKLLAILPVENNKYTIGEKGILPKPANSLSDNFSTEKMPLYMVNNIKLDYVVSDMVNDEQRKKGTRLHNLFKRIKYKDDIDFAFHYFKAKGLIPNECVEDDYKIVREALDDVRVQAWFDRRNKVYNERSMVKGFEKSRPDRVVVTPDDRTIVIDYKFGEVHSASYIKQVQEYMTILSEAGFEKIEGYLWYPLERKIGKVRMK